MCRRDTTDPLLSVFAGRGYNFLRNVRTGVVPGGTWIEFDGTFEPSGSLPDLIEGGFDMPKPTTRRLLDVESRRSDAVSASIGLNVLGPALSAMGVPGALDQVRAGVQQHQDARFHIGLTEVTEKAISLERLAQDLAASQVKPTIAKTLTKGRRVGVAVAVVYSRGLSIDVVDRRGSTLGLGVEVPLVAGVEGRATRDRVTATHLEFPGIQPVAFGVRLYEAKFDATRRCLRIDRVHGHRVLDGRSVEQSPGSGPLLLGGPDDDLFTDL